MTSALIFQENWIAILRQKLEARDFDRWPEFFIRRMIQREEEMIAAMERLLGGKK
ncbi:MAG: hypothetical protein LBV80_08045 [Deltaproteobacteria bacterium]|jgi:hypothetical protein|nr:hypothetical protein [Deltaproteobacteria bacterium]